IYDYGIFVYIKIFDYFCAIKLEIRGVRGISRKEKRIMGLMGDSIYKFYKSKDIKVQGCQGIKSIVQQK
ncbi:MAG: hypothetical protein K2G67_01095, partial [Muribaculaceae bacterium]|nr:hypothetical protein [Muribaculaceae bacterium]